MARGETRTASLAISILAESADPEVLELGRRLIADGQWTALPLLKQAEDAELLDLLERLPRGGDKDMVHHALGYLPELCEGRGSAIAPLLLLLIEVTPWSFCRREGYELLLKLNALPDIAAEVTWDCEDESRALLAPHVP